MLNLFPYILIFPKHCKCAEGFLQLCESFTSYTASFSFIKKTTLPLSIEIQSVDLSYSRLVFMVHPVDLKQHKNIILSQNWINSVLCGQQFGPYREISVGRKGDKNYRKPIEGYLWYWDALIWCAD